LLAHLPKVSAYYWRTQAGAELDLLLFLKGRRIGIEITRADAPTLTPSMRSALADLELHRLLVVYPGSTRMRLRRRWTCCRWRSAWLSWFEVAIGASRWHPLQAAQCDFGSGIFGTTGVSPSRGAHRGRRTRCRFR